MSEATASARLVKSPECLVGLLGLGKLMIGASFRLADKVDDKALVLGENPVRDGAVYASTKDFFEGADWLLNPGVKDLLRGLAAWGMLGEWVTLFPGEYVLVPQGEEAILSYEEIERRFARLSDAEIDTLKDIVFYPEQRWSIDDVIFKYGEGWTEEILDRLVTKRLIWRVDGQLVPVPEVVEWARTNYARMIVPAPSVAEI